MHGHGHKTKNVFNAATNFGFAPVILFLLMGQGLVSVTLFTDLTTNMLG